MVLSLKLRLILLVVAVLSSWVGLINHFLYMGYLKKYKPLIYNSLANKKSLIKLPTFMNLDLKLFWKYNLNFVKEKDHRIKLHKIIYLTISFIFIVVSIILLTNPLV